MRWCYKICGGHTHVSVFMNGSKCGDLVFRNEEFDEIMKQSLRHEMDGVLPIINLFINQTPEEQ